MGVTLYDIPDSVLNGRRSTAFAKFFHNWFEEPFGLARGEVDTEFLDELTPKEHDLAVDLLRRNLSLGHAHIIEGIALLRDAGSIPILRKMLAETTDSSRRLTIAGTLWKLIGDPCFHDEIEHMVRKGNGSLKEAHFDQILWLGDSRAIVYLIDLLGEGDTFAAFLALARLNEIEDNKRYLLGRDEFPHQPDHYLHRREDQSFIQLMATKLNDYHPSTFVMSTVSGTVGEDIQPA